MAAEYEIVDEKLRFKKLHLSTVLMWKLNHEMCKCGRHFLQIRYSAAFNS